MMMVEPGLYEHYKGGMYRVLFCVRDSTNGEHEGRSLVVYVSLTTGNICARDADEFTGLVRVTVDDPSVAFQSTPYRHVLRFRKV